MPPVWPRPMLETVAPPSRTLSESSEIGVLIAANAPVSVSASQLVA